MRTATENQRRAGHPPALDNIELGGISDVARATDSMLGGLVRTPGIWARLGESKTMVGIVALMTALNLAVSTASGALALTAVQPAPSPEQVRVIFEQLSGTPGAPAISGTTPTDTQILDHETGTAKRDSDEAVGN